MNTRLEQFLAAENLTQSQFADTIGVARASVSHILAGRNKPGFDFIENMARHYPALNLEWLVTGKGKMYKGFVEKGPETEDQLIENQAGTDNLFATDEVIEIPETATTKTIAKDNTKKHAENKRVITKIVAFYSDNTFEEFYKF